MSGLPAASEATTTERHCYDGDKRHLPAGVQLPGRPVITALSPEILPRATSAVCPPAGATPETPQARSKIMNLIQINDAQPVNDRFQQQAAEIAAILADPDARLAEEVQYHQFRDLIGTAIGDLRQLRDLVSLSRHTARNLTLARLAELLDQFPPDTPVCYDNGGQVARNFDPYQGNLNHAAMRRHRPYMNPPPATAGQLAYDARSAPNLPHITRKGDEVRLYSQSPVWLAEYGESQGRAVVDVQTDEQGHVVLVTTDPEPGY